MGKTTINLSRAVRVHLDGELSKQAEQSHGLTDVLDLPAGVQEVDEAVADHWFVKAHCEPLPEAEKPKKAAKQGADKPGADKVDAPPADTTVNEPPTE